MLQIGVPELVSQSTIVFKGTVSNVGASSMPEVSASGDVGVVTVDAVLAAAPALGNLESSQVTMRFAGGDRPRVGERAIFFTNPWIYGSKLAVSEIGRVEIAREADVRTAIQQEPDRRLAAHMAGADLVVVGVVEQIGEPDFKEPLSFNAPEWAVATMRVESVVKGKTSADRLEVLFSSAEEDMWQQAPKLQPGQEGVFILRKGEGPFAPPDAYTVIHAMSVHPREAAPRIRQIAKKAG